MTKHLETRMYYTRRIVQLIAALLFLTILFVMAVEPVLASGFMDTAKGFAIEGLVAVLFAIVAAVFGSKWLAFKKPVQALLEVFAEYRRGKLLQSDGGKDLTKAEWNAIFAKMTLAVEAIVAAMPASWLPKRGT